ncbi:MAG TPA: prepilin-type N-terminal cleavage/methylation domain-containing protein [Phycisphaerae bacterium]|nr:prepilin-type N-terminal cleavage/methylation domain-containing protein [Phycisphaerae bacterium]
MRSRNAFTLVEMLAVVGIMLVLMTVTFGMFRLFAERTGPDAAMARIQAFLNGARSHAAATGRDARVEFKSRDTRNDMMQGSTLALQEYYYNASNSRWEWRNVPGSQALAFRDGVYVCRGLPNVGSATPPPPVDPRNPRPDDVARWRQYEQQVFGKIETHALSGKELGAEHDGFYLEFCPAGFPPANPRTNDADIVQDGLTIIQLAGRRVTGHAFYALNTNTGTRLVFE